MTANQFYMVTAYGAGGGLVNRWEYLSLTAAETVKTTMERGTATDISCVIDEQPMETRGQILVRLGQMMRHLPAAADIGFSGIYPHHLRITLDALDSVDDWATALSASVTRSATNHAFHATASVMWRGWWVTLGAFEPHASTAPAAAPVPAPEPAEPGFDLETALAAIPADLPPAEAAAAIADALAPYPPSAELNTIITALPAFKITLRYRAQKITEFALIGDPRHVIAYDRPNKRWVVES